MSILNAVANLGATGIMGYWLIYGLPATLKQMNDIHAALFRELMADHQEDRRVNQDSQVKMAEAVNAVSKSLSVVCRSTGSRPPS